MPEYKNVMKEADGVVGGIPTKKEQNKLWEAKSWLRIEMDVREMLGEEIKLQVSA